MIQDPNPTDYPHLEAFTDWLYEHAEELPTDPETLKARVTATPDLLAVVQRFLVATDPERIPTQQSMAPIRVAARAAIAKAS